MWVDTYCNLPWENLLFGYTPSHKRIEYNPSQVVHAPWPTHWKYFFFSFFFFEAEGRQANAKAQEAVHRLASFPSSREEILQSGFEPPTSSLRFGYPSTITR